MSSLLDRISELEQQLAVSRAEAEKEEKEKEEKENKRWRAKKEDMYWFVDSDGEPTWWHEQSRNIDDFYYDTHNYFQTEEEAQKYANVLETERQLKRFADEHNDKIDWTNINQEKWCLHYSYNYYKVNVSNDYWARKSRLIYFSSKEIAEQAINTIGEEKIKEYLTYEW